jgi:hypothetical protein
MRQWGIKLTNVQYWDLDTAYEIACLNVPNMKFMLVSKDTYYKIKSLFTSYQRYTTISAGGYSSGLVFNNVIIVIHPEVLSSYAVFTEEYEYFDEFDLWVMKVRDEHIIMDKA